MAQGVASPPAPPSADPAPALTRGLGLLRRLGEHGPATLEQLAGATGWPKSSVLRCLQSLTLDGAVRRDPKTRRYEARFRLVRSGPAQPSLIERCGTVMDRLPIDTGHTAELHAWDGSRLTMIDRREPEGAVVTARARIGYQRNLDEIEAVTQVVLAFVAPSPESKGRLWAWDAGRRRRVGRDELRRVVDGVREHRIGVDLGVNENAVRRYAVPVLDTSQQLVGVLAVAQVCGPADPGPSRRIRSALTRASRSLNP